MVTKIVGIDLGTTTSAIAEMDEHDSPKAIPNREGKNTTPSVVGLSDESNVCVGDSAKNGLYICPDTTVCDSKRLMGNVDEKGKHIPCVTTDKKSYTPVVIAAIILKKLWEDAEYRNCVEIKDAVISVPAYFNDVQRSATIAAAELAGLNVIRLINEPTAACIAFAYENVDCKYKVFLVLDVGGGTTDVSIMVKEKGQYIVKATAGDSNLGGKDFDNEIASLVLNAFKNEEDIELDEFEDAAAYADLKDKCERAKCDLSYRNKTVITVSARGKSVSVELTRGAYWEMLRLYWDKIAALVRKALEEAGMSIGPDIICIGVGGSMKSPLLQEAFKEEFGQDITSRGIDVDLAVAYGCAIVANMAKQTEKLAGDDSIEKLYQDVCSHSLGVLARKGNKKVFSPIIRRNSQIPAEAKRSYAAVDINQTSVDIDVRQGEEDAPVEESITLKKFSLNIKPGDNTTPRIQVKFAYDDNGIVQVEAFDDLSGEQLKESVKYEQGMSREEIDASRAELENELTIS